ncbi:MAG: HisA/HisF-related TIM barrel protein [Methanomassiliicoccales archaeon]|jgi:uncharacterized protein related to proFAR isomerase/DNA-directed RNA polymerase subunit RPC12/RpoP
MRQRLPIYACPNCGGRDLVPTVLVGGPMAQLDENIGTYRCEECGKTAVPLAFANVEDWISFRQQAMKRAEEEREKTGFLNIPILPIDTIPLVSIAGMDLPIAKTVEVVSVKWSGHKLERTDYHVAFDRYWAAVAGKRYNATEVLMLDLAGLNLARPNFPVMRELVKRKYDVWLDLGIRSEQDIFDAFSIEVSHALADTITASSIRLFKELYDLSDRCVPCIYYDKKVIWGTARAGPHDLHETVKRLAEIGYEEVAVIDLPALGLHSGVREGFLASLEGLDAELIVGGGIVESDVEKLKAQGFKGVMVDPYTPIIEDIIESEPGSPVETRFPSPAPTTVKKPKYLATD